MFAPMAGMVCVRVVFATLGPKFGGHCLGFGLAVGNVALLFFFLPDLMWR